MSTDKLVLVDEKLHLQMLHSSARNVSLFTIKNLSFMDTTGQKTSIHFMCDKKVSTPEEVCYLSCDLTLTPV